MRWWNGSRSPPRAVERPFKKLVIEGLQHVLGSGEASASMRAEALARLRQGLRLGASLFLASLRMNATLFVDTSFLVYALDLDAGGKRFRPSLWDAMIVAAARASGASELLTEDLNHGQNYGGVRVRNPFVHT